MPSLVIEIEKLGGRAGIHDVGPHVLPRLKRPVRHPAFRVPAVTIATGNVVEDQHDQIGWNRTGYPHCDIGFIAMISPDLNTEPEATHLGRVLVSVETNDNRSSS